jgi:hypothetical protein
VFAAGTAAEIVPGDNDRRAFVGFVLKDVARFLLDAFEAAIAEPFAGDGLEPLRRDDHVGIDVLAPEG